MAAAAVRRRRGGTCMFTLHELALTRLPPPSPAAGQLPAAPRRSASAPSPDVGTSTPPRESDAAARLRLEAENAALSAEVTSIQSRLHDALVRGSGRLLEGWALKESRSVATNPSTHTHNPNCARRCWRAC